MAYRLAADLIHLLHYVVVLVILLAFLVPAGEWLKYHIILICAILLDWNDMDGQCAFTALEAKLRGTWKPGGAAEGEDRPAFWHPLIRKVGVEVTRARAERLNYFLFVLSLLGCFLRYCAYKRIRLNFAGTAGRLYAVAGALMGGLWTANQTWQIEGLPA